MSDIIKYFIEHIESVAKLLSYILLPSIVLIGFMKRVYFNHRYKAPKRVIKLIGYLRKYDNYLDSADKEHIKMRINDEIMRDVARIPSAFNRKELIYIFNKIEKKGFINDLYKLQNNIDKVDGHFFVNIKFSDAGWIISRSLSLVMGGMFFLFIALGGMSIFNNDNSPVFLVFLFMAIVMEVAGIWMFSTFPSRKTIENINVELSKIKAPD
ncbi:hypothetical protein D3C76_1152740 [compost metagenome]